jgi:hypothetical protein
LIIRTDVRKVVESSDKGKWPPPEPELSVDRAPTGEAKGVAWREIVEISTTMDLYISTNS